MCPVVVIAYQETTLYRDIYEQVRRLENLSTPAENPGPKQGDLSLRTTGEGQTADELDLRVDCSSPRR